MGEVIYYKQNPNVIFRPEEDDAIMYNSDTSDSIVVNATAVFIWGLCGERCNVNDMLDKMAEKYEGAPREDMQKDLDVYLEALTQRGFLQKE